MEINVMDVMEQEKLMEAMEYIKAFVKSAKAMLEEKANADDDWYSAYRDMEKVEDELDRSIISDLCESPEAWLEQ